MTLLNLSQQITEDFTDFLEEFYPISFMNPLWVVDTSLDCGI